MSTEKEFAALRYRCEECLVSITWTHKIHEKQADLYGAYSRRLTVASIIVTALTGSGVMSLFATDSLWAKIITSLLAFASLALYIATVAFDFSGGVSDHRHAAKQFLALREEGRDLVALISAEGVSLDDGMIRYRILQGKYQLACSLAPQTSEKARDDAEAAIDKGESTITDLERNSLCSTNSIHP